MRRAGITPVVVFDGRPPQAKAAVVEARRVVRQTAQREMAEIRADLVEHEKDLTEREKGDRERRLADLQKKAPTVSSGEKDALKQFLYAAGVLFLTANGEADDVLAFLARAGFLSAVVSTDMDMLTRGIPSLVVPETNDATTLSELRLDAVLGTLNVSYNQFVDACVLMGSDYAAKSWRGMEPAAALAAARRGVDWGIQDVSGAVCDSLVEGRRMLVGAGVVWETLLGEKQREKWVAGAPAREPANLTATATAMKWPADWVAALL
jgi:flap endonuclease-1